MGKWSDGLSGEEETDGFSRVGGSDDEVQDVVE